MKEYKFKAKLMQSDLCKGGSYIIFPWDIKKEFSKGRIKVRAYFNEIEYYGSIVNMGLKNDKGEIYYIIGVLKSIREKLNLKIGDEINVSIMPII